MVENVLTSKSQDLKDVFKKIHVNYFYKFFLKTFQILQTNLISELLKLQAIKKRYMGQDRLNSQLNHL